MSNAEQIANVRRIIEGLGLEVATHTQDLPAPYAGLDFLRLLSLTRGRASIRSVLKPPQLPRLHPLRWQPEVREDCWRVIGFALPFYRWLHIRRIEQLHRDLGSLEHELARCADGSRFLECQRRIAEIGTAVRLHKVARPFEVDLHRLRIHLRMVQEDVDRKSRNLTAPP